MSLWDDKTLEKLVLKDKTFDQITRIPSVEETIERLKQRFLSGGELRDLGTGTLGDFYISEQDRANHIHILGTTREGKSKFIQALVRGDVKAGVGATVLDPTNNGQTAYDILRDCHKANFKKVCLIDPHDANVAIPCINPLAWRGAVATDAIVSSIMDSLRVLWGQTSFTDTPRIEVYLPAILTVLYNTGNPKHPKPLNCGLPDAINFIVRDEKGSHQFRDIEYRRRQILDYTYKYDESRLVLEEVFQSRALFLQEFKATIRRLTPFFKYLPRLMYGGTEHHMKLPDLIADNWLILVNLDRRRVWSVAAQRLLGTLIVNGILQAVGTLEANHWTGKHYLYIDEAAQFATRDLADIMAHYGKSGVWATVSHQYFGQFEDKYVLDAIANLAKFKVMFYTPNTTDRERMLKDMYFGEVRQTASDALFNLKRQECVIKVGKKEALKIRVDDIKTPEVDGDTLGKWKEEVIYKPNAWYRSAGVIQEEINKRFAVHITQADKVPTHRSEAVKDAQVPDNNATGSTGQPNVQPSPREDKASTPRKSVFDSLPDSQAVLQPKKRRKPGKDIPS